MIVKLYIIFELFFSTAPPSYAECVSGRVNVRDEDDNEYTRGDLNWAPTYTYYTWNPPPGQQLPPSYTELAQSGFAQSSTSMPIPQEIYPPPNPPKQ